MKFYAARASIVKSDNERQRKHRGCAGVHQQHETGCADRYGVAVSRSTAIRSTVGDVVDHQHLGDVGAEQRREGLAVGVGEIGFASAAAFAKVSRKQWVKP